MTSEEIAGEDRNRLYEILRYAGLESEQTERVIEELFDDRYVGSLLWETFIGRLYASMLRALIGDGISLVKNETIIDQLQLLYRLFPDHPGLQSGVPVIMASLSTPSVVDGLGR